jgi:hypothetical protein
MKILVLVLVLIPVLVLVFFTFKKNMKDKNEFEDYIKHDYPGATDKATDIETEEKTH